VINNKEKKQKTKDKIKDLLKDKKIIDDLYKY
jgi:hypothetical protein